MTSLFANSTSLARASDPGPITVGPVAGLFSFETLVPNHSDSLRRTSRGCCPQEGRVDMADTGSFPDLLGLSVFPCP